MKQLLGWVGRAGALFSSFPVLQAENLRSPKGFCASLLEQDPSIGFFSNRLVKGTLPGQEVVRHLH